MTDWDAYSDGYAEGFRDGKLLVIETIERMLPEEDRLHTQRRIALNRAEAERQAIDRLNRAERQKEVQS